jgi:hypothetical protein
LARWKWNRPTRTELSACILSLKTMTNDTRVRKMTAVQIENVCRLSDARLRAFTVAAVSLATLIADVSILRADDTKLHRSTRQQFETAKTGQSFSDRGRARRRDRPRILAENPPVL